LLLLFFFAGACRLRPLSGPIERPRLAQSRLGRCSFQNGLQLLGSDVLSPLDPPGWRISGFPVYVSITLDILQGCATRFPPLHRRNGTGHFRLQLQFFLGVTFQGDSYVKYGKLLWRLMRIVIVNCFFFNASLRHKKPMIKPADKV